jgi:hypothetical protein
MWRLLVSLSEKIVLNYPDAYATSGPASGSPYGRVLIELFLLLLFSAAKPQPERQQSLQNSKPLARDPVFTVAAAQHHITGLTCDDSHQIYSQLA